MEHAGFDKLQSPMGVMLVCFALLLVTAVILFGAFMVKQAMFREKEVRSKMRRSAAKPKDK